MAAGKFANFLGTRYHDPRGRDLLTSRVLLSPTDAETEALQALGVKWEPAEKGTVADALDQWYFDCDSDPANIAVFYVAGHGIVTPQGASSVFLSSAGAEFDPFRSSLDVWQIHDAMKFCRAETNVFVSDCCAVKKFPVNGGSGLVLPTFEDGVEQRQHDLHIVGAKVGTKAYAIGSSEGTLLSYGLGLLLGTAGELVDHPDERDVTYFAVTREKLKERLWPTIREHPLAPKQGGQEPRVHGQHAPGGVHRPQPPPPIEVEFSILNPDRADRVSCTVKDSSGTFRRDFMAVRGEVVPQSLPAGVYELVSSSEAFNFSRELRVDRPTRFDVLSGRSKSL